MEGVTENYESVDFGGKALRESVQYIEFGLALSTRGVLVGSYVCRVGNRGFVVGIAAQEPQDPVPSQEGLGFSSEFVASDPEPLRDNSSIGHHDVDRIT